MENDFVVVFHWPNGVSSDVTLVVERLELASDANISILKIRAEVVSTNVLETKEGRYAVSAIVAPCSASIHCFTSIVPVPSSTR